MVLKRKQYIIDAYSHEKWYLRGAEDKEISGASLEAIDIVKINREVYVRGIVGEFDKLSQLDKERFLSGEISLCVESSPSYQYNPDRGEDDVFIYCDEYVVISK